MSGLTSSQGASQGRGSGAAALTVGLLVSPVAISLAFRTYPLWWSAVTLRLRLAVLRGQTMQRRLARTPPGEVAARALDSERLVLYADRWVDVLIGAAVAVATAAISGSLAAGAVLAAILVPQGMAYAELAGLPPVTGLYTTIACLVGYAFLGPSRTVKRAIGVCSRCERPVASRKVSRVTRPGALSNRSSSAPERSRLAVARARSGGAA